MKHMIARNPRRRATILLMVVSLLALLFIIVTGFLSLARTERNTLQDVRAGDTTDTILDNARDSMLDLAAAQVDGAGVFVDPDKIPNNGDEELRGAGVLAGGQAGSYAAEDIPGYRHSHHIASLEPHLQPYGAVNPYDWQRVDDILWPSVSLLDGGDATRPTAEPLYRLIPESDTDTNADFGVFTSDNDVVRYARRPVNDADADGVPDASIIASAALTDAANAALGSSAALLGSSFSLSSLPDPDTGDSRLAAQAAAWRQWDEEARVEVAVRTVSHGGMLALSSPSLRDASTGQSVPAFNRQFVLDMFEGLRNPADTRTLAEAADSYRTFVSGASQSGDELFDDLAASSPDIEAYLRRGGGLLTPPLAQDLGGTTNEPFRTVPPVLSFLTGQTPGYEDSAPRLTFVPYFPNVNQAPSATTYTRSTRYRAANNWVDTWRPFNLGDSRAGLSGQNGKNEFAAWWRAAVLDPAAFNSQGFSDVGAFGAYTAKHLLTTVNNSDDLARKQVAGDPRLPSLNALPLDNSLDSTPRGTTYQGELKFYLGECTKAFELVGTGQYSYDPAVGAVLIERMARLYYDMLASHDDWSGSRERVFGIPAGTGEGEPVGGENDDLEVVTRRQQAIMLAVNTLAFAAPRDTAGNIGWIEPVYYRDFNSPLELNCTLGCTYLEYTGYAPQPFITEAVVARNEGTTDKAIAVELYNPGDPYFGPRGDTFALPLEQYAIATGQGNPNLTTGDWTRLSALTNLSTDRIDGRSFFEFQVKTGGATFFTNLPEATLTTVPNTGRVTLWRAAKARSGLVERWFCIDEMTVYKEGDSLPEPDTGETNWAVRARDLTPEDYFGSVPDAGGVPLPARWNMALDTRGLDDAFEENLDDTPPTDGAGNAATVAGSVTVPTLPTIPLITMNAGPANDLPMFGSTYDLRPRSFPTPGFLLFVPRYTHVQRVQNAVGVPQVGSPQPMSVILADLFENKYDSNTSDVPADFGHMPIFDNRQAVAPGSYLERVGKLPWGLLVFDYFTTVNPEAPGVDPLRVPGRINVNTAPWHVLAVLPMLGPELTTGELPIRKTAVGSLPTAADPSPAFWNPENGMLVGLGTDVVNGRLRSRLLARDQDFVNQLGVPYGFDTTRGLYRLGPWLAQSAAGYRDGLQILPAAIANVTWAAYIDSFLRNSDDEPVIDGQPTGTKLTRYRPDLYGDKAGETKVEHGVRGEAVPNRDTDGDQSSLEVADRPTHNGFVSVGEFLNAKGLDSSRPDTLELLAGPNQTVLGQGDFVKAVSIMVLLDSQYLTTRSNTFTTYATVMDRRDPSRSVRSQVTFDRSNTLPQLVYGPANIAGLSADRQPLVPLASDTDVATPGLETPVRHQPRGSRPEILVERRGAYFSSRN